MGFDVDVEGMRFNESATNVVRRVGIGVRWAFANARSKKELEVGVAGALSVDDELGAGMSVMFHATRTW